MSLTPEDVCILVSCECKKIHVNKPRFDIPCKGGANCSNSNCFYTHPKERKQPTLNFAFCRYGATCSRASCAFIHPERKVENYVGRAVKKCNLRSNCPDKDGKCKLAGHVEPPPLCKYGVECHRKNLTTNACQYSHIKIQAPCPKGMNCRRENKCWYAFHPMVCKRISQMQFANMYLP